MKASSSQGADTHTSSRSSRLRCRQFLYRCTTGLLASDAFGCIVADEMGLGACDIAYSTALDLSLTSFPHLLSLQARRSSASRSCRRC